MQPLFCSTASPYGIHLSIRDNVCARCGWTPPRFNAASACAFAEEEDGASGTLEEGGCSA